MPQGIGVSPESFVIKRNRSWRVDCLHRLLNGLDLLPKNQNVAGGGAGEPAEKVLDGLVSLPYRLLAAGGLGNTLDGCRCSYRDEDGEPLGALAFRHGGIPVLAGLAQVGL